MIDKVKFSVLPGESGEILTREESSNIGDAFEEDIGNEDTPDQFTVLPAVPNSSTSSTTQTPTTTTTTSQLQTISSATTTPTISTITTTLPIFSTIFQDVETSDEDTSTTSNPIHIPNTVGEENSQVISSFNAPSAASTTVSTIQVVNRTSDLENDVHLAEDAGSSNQIVVGVDEDMMEKLPPVTNNFEDDILLQLKEENPIAKA